MEKSADWGRYRGRGFSAPRNRKKIAGGKLGKKQTHYGGGGNKGGKKAEDREGRGRKKRNEKKKESNLYKQIYDRGRGWLRGARKDWGEKKGADQPITQMTRRWAEDGDLEGAKECADLCKPWKKESGGKTYTLLTRSWGLGRKSKGGQKGNVQSYALNRERPLKKWACAGKTEKRQKKPNKSRQSKLILSPRETWTQRYINSRCVYFGERKNDQLTDCINRPSQGGNGWNTKKEDTKKVGHRRG